MCYRTSVICSFIWKQLIIWLTSFHLRDCMFLAYILKAYHMTALKDLPSSRCQLLPRSPNKTSGSEGRRNPIQNSIIRTEL